ncbi:MAG: GNAT family N-acetyltransferase [Bacteroidia bacterium]|nr:GNAT family N-acetyltransferase [Bacteroidia bacterium]
MKIFTETDRIIMRELIVDDVADLFEMDSDPEVHKYLGGNTRTSLEESERDFEYIQGQYKENGIGRWAVIEKSSGDFLGWSGLKLEKELRPEFEYYDLGYRLKKRHWGKGYATEAAIATLKYGFEKMELLEINACAHIDNIGSNKILGKIGMRFIEQFYYQDILCNWYGLKRDGYVDHR